MNDYSTDDVASFADRPSSMTEDELFTAMRDLEARSEAVSRDHRDSSDVLVRIALVEDEIEDRYPGQALAPYKQWQRRGQ